MGMNRDLRIQHRAGAAFAALAPLLAALLALPAAAGTAATAATAASSATATDSARHPAAGLPASPANIADTSRPAPSPSPNPVPPTRTARVSSPAPDAFVCAVVGIIPLASGYYLTSAPSKGIAFSLADAVLIGSIWNIRRDDNIPDRDVAPYFFLLGAVNALDAVLSGLQARNDAVRIRTTLTPSGEPTVGLAWTF